MELILPGDWSTLFEDGSASRQLEQTILLEFIAGRRWFGGKARKLQKARIVDWATLREDSPMVVLALVEVAFEDGARSLYFLPLGISTGAAGETLLEATPTSVLARVRGPAGAGVLHDALASDAACTELLLAIEEGRTIAARHGQIRAERTSAYLEARGPSETLRQVSHLSAGSSNTLLIYGDRLILKLIRRLEPGQNPDFEIGWFLTEKTTFDRVPRTAGAIEYARPDGEPITLALLQAIVPNQGDAWQYTLDEVATYFHRVEALDGVPGEKDASLADDAMMGDYASFAGLLGRRTGEMHQALASRMDAPAFSPEPMTLDDLASIARRIHEQADHSLALLRTSLDRLPSTVAAEARLLLEKCTSHFTRAKGLPAAAAGTTRIRCHGDYHLGQVLRSAGDVYILDFEGEPTRSLVERRAKQSPLKDVAGMLRSFGYAAHAGLFAFCQDRPERFAALEPWAEVWQRRASAEFLNGYRKATAGASFLPADAAHFMELLQCFVLEKAFYELVYELNHRPDWVRIPLRGILAFVQNSN